MDIRNWRLLQYELSYGCIKKINVHKQSFTGSFFRWLTVFLFKFKAGARLIPALKLKSNTITGSKSKLCSVCSLISLQYSTKKMVRAVKTRVNVCSNLQAQKRKFSCFWQQEQSLCSYYFRSGWHRWMMMPFLLYVSGTLQSTMRFISCFLYIFSFWSLFYFCDQNKYQYVARFLP